MHLSDTLPERINHTLTRFNLNKVTGKGYIYLIPTQNTSRSFTLVPTGE